ncbi:hypothetical protein ACFRCQ_18190 [Cytobacillus firmus]|uniref:hypothetical protein n=1 Tax=Cytobacillus firmus TaxID=1399 RepID=UPI0036ABCDAD
MDDQQIFKHFGNEKGFAHVLTSVLRMYTLLPDFDVTHAGLYAYFRSWRNSTDEDRLNLVWHSKQYMYAQSGLGRSAFDSRLKVLIKYGLITPIKSELVPNKDIYYVHDPLSRDKFLEVHKTHVETFFKKVEEIESITAVDRERRKSIARQKLTEDVLRLNAQNQQQNG